MKNTIAEKITQARLSQKLSQNEMAKRLNIAVSRYQHWEAGRAEPPIEMLIEICRTLGIPSLDALLSTPLSSEKRDRVFSAYMRAPERTRQAVQILLGIDC